MRTSGNVLSVVILGGCLLVLAACAIGGLKQAEIDPWLNNISGGVPPAMDLSGAWYDDKGNFMFGWGEGQLRQEQGRLTGAIGNYNVKGRVGGKKVYLVFLSGGKVYYTARLEQFDEGVLTGEYFDAHDRLQANGYPTSLARKKD